MKTGIHPEMYDVVFIDTSSGAEFISQSTFKTKEKKKINGKDHYVIKIEISSSTHPFYTGKQKLVDTSGRVDKFMAKMKKAQAHAEKNVKTVEKDEAEEVAQETAEKEKKATNKEEKTEKTEKAEESEAKVEEKVEKEEKQEIEAETAPDDKTKDEAEDKKEEESSKK